MIYANDGSVEGYLVSFGMILLTTGGLAMLILEGVKWLIILFKKDPDFKLPVKVIVISLPILSFAMQPFFAWLGIGDFTIPADWIGWIKTLIVISLSSVMSVVIYNLGIDSLNGAARERLMRERTTKS